MYSLKFTIIFLLILSIPFFLRWKELEPYPSVLMPEGAHIYYRVNGNINVPYDFLYAKNLVGEWQKVNIDSFMGQVPVQYYPYVVSKIFNSDSIMRNSRRFRIMEELSIDNRYKWAGNERQVLNAWVKERLTAQGLNSSAIKRVGYDELIATSTKKVVSKTINKDQTINLNE